MPSVDDYDLRPLRQTDLEQVLIWRNSDRIRAISYTNHVISREEHQAWFERVSRDPATCHLIFQYLGRPVGLVNFMDIDRRHGTCRWGFYLGEQNLPRGSGTVMGYLALNWIFREQELRKVGGEVLSFNQASMKFFLRLGFTEDGRLRQHLLKNGEYVDVILYSLLADEWTSEKDRIEKLIYSGAGECRT